MSIVINNRRLRVNQWVVLSVLFVIAIATYFLVMRMITNDDIAPKALYNAGVDIFGTFACAILCIGCMGEKDEEGARATLWFLALIFVTSLSFHNNIIYWFAWDEGGHHELLMALNGLTKILDFILVLCFYKYARNSLDFKGKLAKWLDRAIVTLLVPMVGLIIFNHFHPICFDLNDEGLVEKLDLYSLVDIYMMIVAPITIILTVRSDVTQKQKLSTFSFIVIPIFHYAISKGAHGYATQYGSVLLALILMYCFIFNERSKKLAATKVELDTANTIQQAMMPHIFPAFPDRREFDLYASMDAAKEVGGDFYDYFLIDDDHLCLVMADVSGKGVPAALFMMASKIIIQSCAMLGVSAGEILTKTNTAICSNNPEEMFVTVWLGILEISTGKLTYANGGHEYPAIKHGNNGFKLLKGRHDLVVGGLDGIEYKESTIDLFPGDKIFLYTDGVPEATDINNGLYGTARMVEALNEDPNASPKQLLANIRQSVDDYVGFAEQFDDLTMLCFEYKGPQA